MSSHNPRGKRQRRHSACILVLVLLINLLPLPAFARQSEQQSGGGGVVKRQEEDSQAPEASGDGRSDAAKSPQMTEFRDWLEQYKIAGAASASEQMGEALAKERRAVMARLVNEDPASAVEMAVPTRLREKLPPQIQQYVEEQVSGYGDYLVRVFDETDPATGQFSRSRTERKVVLGGRTYDAKVYGRKLGMTTKLNIPLRGVVVGDTIALAESPVRVLDEEERDPSLAGQGVDAEVGGKVLHFDGPEQLEQFEEGLKKREMSIGPGAGPAAGAGDLSSDMLSPEAAPADDVVAASSWTEGPKTLLFMRVDFSDKPGEPVTLAAAQSLMTDVDNFYKNNSYNKTSITSTVTPLLRMPQTSAYYITGTNNNQLLTDARAAAKAAGYDTANYSLDVVAFTSIGYAWAGLGYVGGKGTWVNGEIDLRVLSHEIGHNYGLNHANSWQTTDGTANGAGTSSEYGDPFDAMGGGFTTSTHHFNAWFKNLLDWLPSADVLDVGASGTYRIQAYDFMNSTGRRALKIQRDATTYYWVEFRQAITDSASVFNGATIHWGYTTNRQSNLLDMTPTSASGINDAALPLGQTFTDSQNGIKITAVGKAATSPTSLDVTVTYTTNLNTLTLSPSPVVGGAACTGTVTLNAPAPAAGAVVTLSDNIAATTVPASVTIPAGATSKTFTITTAAVSAAQTGTVTASYRGVAKNIPLSVQPVALSSLALSRSAVGGGGPVTGTVTLNGPAPSTGAVVTLSDNIAAATTPASVTVPAGAKTKTFTITTVPVTVSQPGAVTASYGGVVKTAALSVDPITFSALTVSPASAAGGNNVTGTVTLNGPAPATGLTVTLSDNIAATTVPLSVVVPAGASSKTFTITTVLVSAAQSGTVTGKYGAVVRTAALTVRPAVFTSLTLNPASVAGGNNVTGTVTLDGPAPSTGALVTLSDNLAAANTPASVTVPSGAKSATFTITTAAVTAAQAGTVTGVYAGVTKTAALTVRLISVQSVVVAPNPIVGGSSATATVTLDRLPTSNVVVTLSDTLAATTIPASITIAANTLSNTFTVSTVVALPSQKGTLSAAANGLTKSVTLSVVNTQSQLLANPGFELGQVSWVANNPPKIFDNSNGSRANSGLWDAWLGGYGAVVSENFYQDATIPANAISANLNFYLWLPTNETTTTAANDTLKVQILNTSGVVLATPAVYSNLNKNGWYVKKTISLLPYKGQKVRIYFLSSENSSLVSWFFLDDITLDVVQ